MASLATIAKDGEEHLGYVLGLAAEIAPVLVLVTDRDGYIRYFNPSCEKLTGYRRAEVLGTSIKRLLPPGAPVGLQTPCLSRPCGQAFTESHIVPWPTKSGDQRIIEWRCAAVGGMKDEARFVLCVGRDVTQEIQTEAALLDAESLNRIIAGLISDYAYICGVTRRGGVLGEWMTESFSKVFGLKPDHVRLHSSWKRLIHPEDFPRALEHARKVTSGRVDVCEMRWVTSAGEVRWVRNYLQPVFDTSGRRVVRIYGAAQDITERKRAEENLRRSEALFRALFHDHTAVELLIDPRSGQILDVNQAAVNFYGWSREQLLGMRIQDINTLPPDEVKKQMDLVCELKRVHFEFQHRRADGSIRDVEVFSCRIGIDGNSVLHSIIHDITRRKQAEAERNRMLQHLQRSLISTVQAMAAMTEKRDPYTAGHQRNVTKLSSAIAAEMKLDEDRSRGLWLAAMIHDIGKIGVPADILTKPARLTPPERSLVETHVLVGYDILKDMEFPWPIARMVLEHHERVNGSGYPNRLTGDQMLVESKIIAVADVVEAIAMHRPYRAARGQEAALAEIKKNRGILYDSEVVDACVRLFEKKGYRLEGTWVSDCD